MDNLSSLCALDKINVRRLYLFYLKFCEMILSENEITLNELSKALQIYHEHFNFSKLANEFMFAKLQEISEIAFSKFHTK